MAGFWQWLKNLRHEAKAELHLRKHTYNLKCPHCEVWTSDTKGKSSIENCGHPIAVRYTCGGCKQRSYWIFEAGFWIRAENWNIHIKEEDGDGQGNV